MGTRVYSRARCRRPAGTRLLLAGAILTAGLGLALTAEAQAAKVKASVTRGTLTVTGTSSGEKIVLRQGAPGRLVVDVRDNGTADFRFRRNRFMRIVVNARSGNDLLRIDERNGRFTNAERTTLSGKAGRDTLLGGSFGEILNGGAGNDTVDGNQGGDTARLGAGTDTFVWDPGDGSDIIEGQADADTLRFNGSAAAEVFAASANGGRLLFTRNVGNIVMDTDGVENLALNALGGADSVTLNDLAATDVDAANVELGVAGAGDGATDAIVVNGTNAVDVMSLSGSGGSVTLSSASIALAITNAEPVNDSLTVNALAGADLASASGLASTSVLLTLNGGSEEDILVGSQGNDTINGDAGDDLILGGDGDDLIQGGDGNDTLDGGADTDTIDGGAGIDTSTNGENITNVP